MDGISEESLMAYNHRLFDQYNHYKSEFLYQQLPMKKKAVFDLIPLFLHLSGENLLECDPICQVSPHGIYGYEPDNKTEESFGLAFPNQEMPLIPRWANRDPNQPIKSLSLMGSLGSVAQNPKSDFDYWICFDGRHFNQEKLSNLKAKLWAIEKWAERYAEAEVHFFPLDLENVRVDDFGLAGRESSGTAQGRLLKEEFYRTMTLVAGQVPMWWVMPPGVSDGQYRRLVDLIKQSERIDSSRLVDMGNVQRISLGDLFGAAIWQINKTIGSPFKSVLKMALVEDYMHHAGLSLLCDQLKRRLLDDSGQVRLLDPYILMFERAAAFMKTMNRPNELDLLRRSLYLKVQPRLTLNDLRTRDLPRKKRIMVKLVKDWGWDYNTIKELNNYHFWTFGQSQRFSNDINKFIFKTYKTVFTELKRQKVTSNVAISKRDLKVLSRKLGIFFARRPHKVDSIKNVIEAPPRLTGLTIQPFRDPEGVMRWGAYRGLFSREKLAEGQGENALLRTSRHLAEILIWLAHNRLFQTQTSLNLNQGEGDLENHCTVPDIQAVLKQMSTFFPQYKHKNIEDDQLLNDPINTRMLFIVNLEQPDGCHHIEETELCYQNNWGEVFFRGFDSPLQGIEMARKFLWQNLRESEATANLSLGFKIFVSERHQKQFLVKRLNKLFGLKAISMTGTGAFYINSSDNPSS